MLWPCTSTDLIAKSRQPGWAQEEAHKLFREEQSAPSGGSAAAALKKARAPPAPPPTRARIVAAPRTSAAVFNGSEVLRARRCQGWQAAALLPGPLAPLYLLQAKGGKAAAATKKGSKKGDTDKGKGKKVDGKKGEEKKEEADVHALGDDEQGSYDRFASIRSNLALALRRCQKVRGRAVPPAY